MASTPATDLATRLLRSCLEDGKWNVPELDTLLDQALSANEETARTATRAFFGIVIESLGDLFEPSLCELYAEMFSHVIARALPEYRADQILARYHRIRSSRRFAQDPALVRNVYVLSRVTLGADVAVTSVALDAAKQKFPHATIHLVGPAKNCELFAADPRINPTPVSYGRSGLLRDRLAAAVDVRGIVDQPNSIVIDPDSRLTQLGLIPVCAEDRYYFFESRSFGGESREPLPLLYSEWLKEVFGVMNAFPYLSPASQHSQADITVSFGVGGNQAKRVVGDFEFQVLQHLLSLGHSVLIDRGAGDEEAQRIDALVERCHSPLASARGSVSSTAHAEPRPSGSGSPSQRLHVHNGSYASFASHILQSKLYVGYDSAGQHVAAAGGVPLVSVFGGYVSQRMFDRWRPFVPSSGRKMKTRVIDAGIENMDAVLKNTLQAISELAP